MRPSSAATSKGSPDALTATAYRPEIEAMLAVGGPQRVGAASSVDRNLGRNLDELRAFYDGPARTLVDLLLARYDLHNLLVLLRGLLRARPSKSCVRGLSRSVRSAAPAARGDRAATEPGRGG